MAQDEDRENDRDLHKKIDQLTNSFEILSLQVQRLQRYQVQQQEELRRQQEEHRRQLDEQRRLLEAERRRNEEESRRTTQRRSRRQQERQQNQAQERVEEFQEGDRVVILNNYRNQQGRTAVVTRTYQERVYFTLDGRPTYRLRQNLRRID